jgi:hypothetical protein
MITEHTMYNFIVCYLKLLVINCYIALDLSITHSDLSICLCGKRQVTFNILNITNGNYDHHIATKHAAICSIQLCNANRSFFLCRITNHTLDVVVERLAWILPN